MRSDVNAEDKLPFGGSTDHSVLANLELWQPRCIIFDMFDDDGICQALEAGLSELRGL